jgi:protocatechuate 3,4-dioxygenase beta subunit
MLIHAFYAFSQVTQGPYHILGELYRQNVTEDQSGIPVTYNVDFVDVETCEPLANAWVDYWSANATVSRHEISICQDRV